MIDYSEIRKQQAAGAACCFACEKSCNWLFSRSVSNALTGLPFFFVRALAKCSIFLQQSHLALRYDNTDMPYMKQLLICHALATLLLFSHVVNALQVSRPVEPYASKTGALCKFYVCAHFTLLILGYVRLNHLKGVSAPLNDFTSVACTLLN